MEMNTTHLQVIEVDDFYHLQIKDDKGISDRVVLSANEWQFALHCMNATAPFYPYFEDGNYLVQIISKGIRIKSTTRAQYVPYGQVVETHIYLFPMHVVAENYPNQRIWDEYDCAALKMGWNSNGL